MYLERNQDLSVLKFLKDTYADAPFINVVDDYPTQEIILPTIALELDVINARTHEMGNREFNKTRTWFIDIFAENKAQRDEYGYRLLYQLEKKINVYDFDQGFDNPVKVGVLDPDNVQLRIIKVLPELTELMYYRSAVTFTATYEAV